MVIVQKYQRNSIIALITLLIGVLIIALMNKADSTPPEEEPKKELLSLLPYTAQVYEGDEKPETIAYRLWFELMDTLESRGAIDSKSFTRFTKLSGDDNEFVAAVVFQIQLPEEPKAISYDWGEVQDNRVVQDIVWKLTIQKVESLTYSLTKIERSTDTFIGLPPVDSMDDYQEEAGIENISGNIKYELMDETLKVTYNGGQDWQTVPVDVEELFQGEYNGPKYSLIEGSYVISPERTAFVLGGAGELRILQSMDQGMTWDEVLVSDQLPVVRMRILGFTSDQDGYLIVTGDRTMRSEGNMIFKTNDGGTSWYNVGSVNDVYRLVTDGGFINDQLGFVSFGELRFDNQPPVPDLYRTTDGGATWERVEVSIPEEYKGYFTTAEVPTFNGAEGTLLVNQGPEGDYFGGKVLAKFTSQDQGKIWTFVGLVDPDGVLGE